MMPMRTTINIDDDLHVVVRSVAHQSQRSMTDTINVLLRRGLSVAPRETERHAEERDPLTGFPLIRSARPITEDDVRSLEDHE